LIVYNVVAFYSVVLYVINLASWLQYANKRIYILHGHTAGH